jgi:hypothetical protein
MAWLSETIDRIEANVESIHANLEKADKLIRGMESLPAYIGQKFRKKGAKPPPVVDPPDRTVRLSFFLSANLHILHPTNAHS